ncbi:MAG TPA: CBS domain-containing protein [Dehalococcoidia bacterium]|nr:CBS domain-containing protein [Dehalococcoidia bacterium]
MSPRAAWRLETLLFDQVYDYVAGKDDWLSAGLPIEGEMAEHHHLLAIDAVRHNLPICRYTDRLAHVSDLLLEPGQVDCVVLNSEDVVLGRLPKKAFDRPGETLVEEVMEPGPATFRPGTPLEEITPRMQKARVKNVLVTTAEGRFVGVLNLEDAERELARASVPGGRA